MSVSVIDILFTVKTGHIGFAGSILVSVMLICFKFGLPLLWQFSCKNDVACAKTLILPCWIHVTSHDLCIWCFDTDRQEQIPIPPNWEKEIILSYLKSMALLRNGIARRRDHKSSSNQAKRSDTSTMIFQAGTSLTFASLFGQAFWALCDPRMINVTSQICHCSEMRNSPYFISRKVQMNQLCLGSLNLYSYTHNMRY